MYTSSIEVEHLKKIIREKIKYSYLDKYIKEPTIDQYKLSVLYYTVHHANLSELQKRKYIITTMLIQIALDTHELVPVSNEANESNFRKTSRQLKVLAGDYFSSLYYLILSEIEDINLIQTLAIAIKEINELKMKRYYKEVNSFEKFVEIEQKIESLLFTRLSNFLNVPMMTKIYENLMIAKKLVQEKVNFHMEEETPFLEKWISGTTPNAYAVMIEKVESIIAEKFIIIHKELSNLPNDLQLTIQSIAHELESLNKTVVGELDDA